jgi:hypothetical protein
MGGWVIDRNACSWKNQVAILGFALRTPRPPHYLIAHGRGAHATKYSTTIGLSQVGRDLPEAGHFG